MTIAGQRFLQVSETFNGGPDDFDGPHPVPVRSLDSDEHIILGALRANGYDFKPDYSGTMRLTAVGFEAKKLQEGFDAGVLAAASC